MRKIRAFFGTKISTSSRKKWATPSMRSLCILSICLWRILCKVAKKSNIWQRKKKPNKQKYNGGIWRQTNETTYITPQVQVHHKNYTFWIHCLKIPSDWASYIDGFNKFQSFIALTHSINKPMSTICVLALIFQKVRFCLLIDWLIDWLIFFDWLIDWFIIDWLIDLQSTEFS